MYVRLAFTLALATLVGSMLLMALGLNPMASRVPVVVLTPVFGVLLAQLVVDLRGARSFASGDVSDRRPTSLAGWCARLWARPECRVIAVVVAIGVAVDLLGIAVAVPLLLGLFLLLVAQTPPGQALAAALGVLAVIELGLDGLLGATLPYGRLWLWLGLY